MPIANHPPGPTAPTSHLTAEHAHVLLDGLVRVRVLIEQGDRPWADYDTAGPTDSMFTETGYRVLLETARRVLTTLVDADNETVLVAHGVDEAHADANLNLRSDPANAEEGDRSPRVVVDLHGVTVDVQRRADHTTVDLNTDDVPEEFAPVRVHLGDTELTDPVHDNPGRNRDL